jgi:acyl-CoA dehydrogenase
LKIELSESTLEWQAKAREYADAYLLPHEVEAELNGGVLHEEITTRNKSRAIELGFNSIDVPKDWGGLALPPG